ncbi:hypothetical protein [Streptomyces goshikiensis]|uniref:hypothetical protein n=1 Tax=Streptomyces goshikiensis TaxID=1942 RepID=UPI0036B80E8B
MTSYTPVPHSEETVLSYLRALAQLYEGSGYQTQDWAFSSPYHLVLDQGRRFTAPLASAELAVADAAAIEVKECFGNAAWYADRHPGLLYAEGYALPHHGAPPVEHGWCVRPDGTVLDPSWTSPVGLAYIGLVFGNPTVWPYNGRGILQDPDRSFPLLQHGAADGLLLSIGRPL